MKLTIAAGILATRTLPVVSKESHQSKENPMDFEEGSLSALVSELFITSEKKKHHPQGRIGTKARTWGKPFYQHSHHRSEDKLLVNKARLPKNGKKLCDPSSLDADIGMLSCGLGYECIIDEASTLGGICAPSMSRDLQENPICYVCGRPFTVAQANYGIVIEDAESSYGGKTCGDIDNAAYYSRSIEASRCEAVASVAQAAGCCAPKCDLCEFDSKPPHPRYYSDSFVHDIVVDGLTLPGYDGAVTCKNLAYASYRKGSIDLESCPIARQAAIEAGCCIPYYCLVCDYETYVPYSLNHTTCNDLRPSVLMYSNNTSSEESCLAATQLAAEKGCCVPRPVYDDCDICGNATFYPDNPMYQLGTCENAKARLNDEYCAAYGPDLVPFCCGPSLPPGDEEDTEPSPTPDESTGEPGADPAPSTSPPSASSPMWSTVSSSLAVSAMTISLIMDTSWWLELN